MIRAVDQCRQRVKEEAWCSRKWVATWAACVAFGAGNLVAQDTNVATHVTGEARREAEALLARPVTLDLRRVSLEAAIDNLSRASNVVVEYQAPILRQYTNRVTLQARNLPLGVALERALDGTTLRVVPTELGALAIVAGAGGTPDSAIASGTVSGRVVDSATGLAINGATVKIAGTKTTVVTSDSGRFALLRVPVGDAMLSIRAFGYRPATRAVTVAEARPVTVRIALPGAPNVLSGVVTTATGVQERRTIGNDITVIHADSVMRVAPVTSVTDLLTTRVPGLTVQRTSGIPGSPSRLRLRGIGGGLVSGAENTSNDPIVIVDGIRVYARQSTSRDQNLAPVKRSGSNDFEVESSFPTPSALDQIDPSSVETIEVFKGPSATSQWGSDAGNGVIVITTKRGRVGPTQLRGSVSTGVESMPGTYALPGYYVFGRQSYVENAPSILCDVLNPGVQRCVAIDSVIPFQAANSPRLSPFGTGTRSDGSATVSGGSGALTYSLTGSASNELGYLKMPAFYRDLYRTAYGTEVPGWMKRPTAYKTWGANTAVGLVPVPGLQLTLGGSFTTGDQRQGSGESDLATLSSTYLDTVYAGPLKSSTTGQLPPASAVAAYIHRSTSHNVTTQGNATANWTRWRMLPLQATAGVQTLERTDKQLEPFGLLRSSGGVGDTLGAFGVGHGRSVVRTGGVNTTIPLGRVFKAAAGANISVTSTEDFSAFKDTLEAGVSEPSVLSTGTQSSSSLTTAGWFLEPQFNSQSRFFITPGFRFDGGSGATGSGSGRSLSLFPKLNLSWIAIDREGGEPLAGVVTMLRTRLAFGIAGVQPEPAWRTRLITRGTVLDPIDGTRLGTLGNTSLHPERSRELEGGFEATLWNGRANLNVTGYNKLRSDAIQQITTAPSVYGGQPFYLNVGRVRNTGADVSADARVLETGMVAWGVNATLSAYRNKLVTLYGNVSSYSGGGTRFVQGYPIGGQWSRPILGYNDTNGDGKISIDEVSIADQAVYVGDGQPNVEIPFGTTVSLWHGMLGITAQLDYKGGVTQKNTGGARILYNLYADTAASLSQQAIAIASYYCGSFNQDQGCGNNQGTDYGVLQTVSTLRFNSLSINYAVPSSVSAHFGIPKLAIALQGSNLGLWTNYRGKDPDVNASIVGEALVDSGIAPLPRSWLLRFDLGN